MLKRDDSPRAVQLRRQTRLLTAFVDGQATRDDIRTPGSRLAAFLDGPSDLRWTTYFFQNTDRQAPKLLIQSEWAETLASAKGEKRDVVSVTCNPLPIAPLAELAALLGMRVSPLDPGADAIKVEVSGDFAPWDKMSWCASALASAIAAAWLFEEDDDAMATAQALRDTLPRAGGFARDASPIRSRHP